MKKNVVHLKIQKKKAVNMNVKNAVDNYLIVKYMNVLKHVTKVYVFPVMLCSLDLLVVHVVNKQYNHLYSVAQKHQNATKGVIQNCHVVINVIMNVILVIAHNVKNL